jgi:hypothetical protein
MPSIKNEALAWAVAEVEATGATGIPPTIWRDMFAGALDDYKRALLPVLTVPPQYLPPHDRGPFTSSTVTPVYLRLPDEFIVEDGYDPEDDGLAGWGAE